VRFLNCLRSSDSRLFLASLMAASVTAASVLLSPTIAVADEPIVNEKFADAGPAIQMMRDEMGQDRRAVVKAAMLLTPTEAKTFWPLYDEYRAEMRKVGDRRVKMISDYAAHRDAMSEDEAHRLMKEALEIEERIPEVKEDYMKKMMKVLSARTVARFFHIDSKLDAIVNAELAANIPLIH
jgi:hypothetical protein